MQCYLALCYNANKTFLSSTQVSGNTPEEAADLAGLKISETMYVEIYGQIYKIKDVIDKRDDTLLY